MDDDRGWERTFSLGYEQETAQLKTLRPILKCDLREMRIGECDPLEPSRFWREQLPPEYRHEEEREKKQPRFGRTRLDQRAGRPTHIRIGVEDPIDRSRFRAAEIMSIKADIERCKKYLMARNNAGELNIELLTLVTVGNSAIPAISWCIDDWFLYPAFVNGRKQGQDIKAIAMIGPTRRFKSASLASNHWMKPCKLALLPEE